MISTRAMAAIVGMAVLAGIGSATGAGAGGEGVGRPRETRQAVEVRCIDIGDKIAAQVSRLKVTDTFSSQFTPWSTSVTLQLADDGDELRLECETYGRVSLSIHWDGTVLPPPHLPPVFISVASAMLGVPAERISQAVDACRKAKGRGDIKRDGVTVSCSFYEEDRSGWIKAFKPWAAIDRDAGE